MSRGSKTIASALATGMCLAAVAAPAQAKHEGPLDGHATVTPSSEVSGFLQSRGITVTPISPASVENGSITMPFVRGRLEVSSMRGSLEAGGGLQYAKGTKELRVTRYKLTRTGHGAKLTAFANDRRVRIATLVDMTVTRSGKRSTITGGLRMSAPWVRRINDMVGEHVFHRGEDLGDLTATVRNA